MYLCLDPEKTFAVSTCPCLKMPQSPQEGKVLLSLTIFCYSSKVISSRPFLCFLMDQLSAVRTRSHFANEKNNASAVYYKKVWPQSYHYLFQDVMFSLSYIHGQQYPGWFLRCTSSWEAAVGKVLSNFEAEIFACTTLIACNSFGGNKIKIMKPSVNRDTLELSLFMQKWRRDVLVHYLKTTKVKTCFYWIRSNLWTFRGLLTVILTLPGVFIKTYGNCHCFQLREVL